MQAPLTVKVMNEAASSSHARRADGRGASGFIVSATSGLYLPAPLDDVAVPVFSSFSLRHFDRRRRPQHFLQRGRHHVEHRAGGADDFALADEAVQLIGVMQMGD